MAMLTVPDEILYRLLTFVEDTDLETLAMTCKRLRRFTMDKPLRRYILLKRTPARLQSSLARRPSRDTLARQNILRGIHLRQQIHDGQYIGGPMAVQSYHVSCQLGRQIVSMKIAKKLRIRPDWTELVERGLIPEEMVVNDEEYETRRKWRVYQQQKEEEQKQQQQQRHRAKQQTLETLSRQPSGIQWMDRKRVASPPPPPSVPLQWFSSSIETIPCPTRPRRKRKSISMALVPTMDQLRKAMDRDRLSRLVQNRASSMELDQNSKTATALEAYHLLACRTTSPDLVPLIRGLQFLFQDERPKHWLHRRSSLPAVLDEQHVLKSEVRTAWMVCPGVRHKVKFYEELNSRASMEVDSHSSRQF